VLLACDVVSLLALASVPIAAWCGVLTVPQLLAVALVAGASAVFFSTAYAVFLPSIVAADDLVEGNTTLEGGRRRRRSPGRERQGCWPRCSVPSSGCSPMRPRSSRPRCA
jgi:hypothetical protein